MSYTRYPYKRIRVDHTVPGEDSILARNYFSFKSTLSNQEYIVYVDEYPYSLLVVKFFLKKDKDSKTKFNILSSLNEPRNVVYTCASILQKEFIAKKPNDYSIAFIGANSIKESSHSNTKRFLFYRNLLASIVNPDQYFQYEDSNNSAYLLVPNKLATEYPEVIDCIQILWGEYECEDIVSEEDICQE